MVGSSGRQRVQTSVVEDLLINVPPFELQCQIGNLLSSKLGSRMEVERLIDEEQLILLPMSDIRGYDTSGMRAGIYI